MIHSTGSSKTLRNRISKLLAPWRQNLLSISLIFGTRFGTTKAGYIHTSFKHESRAFCASAFYHNFTLHGKKNDVKSETRYR
ncbi:hypothetical protein V1477_012738 [Vespula maculifrons]|uniref:Uncharacterized protein n=1 Tax=Vespula maculifrons TaxID=7453 RepID=A0ABD2BUE2_VESMC